MIPGTALVSLFSHQPSMSTTHPPAASTAPTSSDADDAPTEGEIAQNFLAAVVALPHICSNCLARKPDHAEAHFRSVGGCHDEQLADRFCPECGTGTGKDPAISTAVNVTSHLSLMARRECGGTLARQCPPLPLRDHGHDRLTFLTVCERAHARLRELDFDPAPLPQLRKAGVAAKRQSGGGGRDHDALAAGIWAVLDEPDRQRARALTTEA